MPSKGRYFLSIECWNWNDSYDTHSHGKCSISRCRSIKRAWLQSRREKEMKLCVFFYGHQQNRMGKSNKRRFSIPIIGGIRHRSSLCLLCREHYWNGAGHLYALKQVIIAFGIEEWILFGLMIFFSSDLSPASQPCNYTTIFSFRGNTVRSWAKDN